MYQNVFVQMTKLHHVKGRIKYISGIDRQEHLYAVYRTEEEAYWTVLAKENRDDFKRSGASGKCVEARELIIALPPEFVKYEPNDLLREYTDAFRSRYGVECVSALHHNKRMTNYHIHLIFSERKMRDEPLIKVASRNMFYDENGRYVRTKKEITDENGNIRKGCRIIKKGEPYEEHLFEKKEQRFKQKSFLNEVKEFYMDKINERMEDSRYKMRVFDPNGPYLPTKKIGKNNPKAKQIKEGNRIRLKWNNVVSRALSSEVPRELISAVRINEISRPISESVNKERVPSDLILRIIDRAARTLGKFVRTIISERLKDTIRPYDDMFHRVLDYSRGPLRKTINRDHGAR